MTFLEAALEVLRREGKPLHYKDLTERAMGKKLLTFVGRTPEVTMQTQLTAAVKKAPGSPFVRVKPGVFGLLRYPEMPPDPEPEADDDSPSDSAAGENGARGDAARGRRRRRRGGRGRTARTDEGATTSAASESGGPDEGGASEGEGGEGAEEPRVGRMSAADRAAALAETGVLEGDDDAEGEGEGEGEGDLDDNNDAAGGRGSVGEGGRGLSASPGLALAEGDLEEIDEDDEGEGTNEAADSQSASGEGALEEGSRQEGEGDEPGRRRRRRRRRRRGGDGPMPSAVSSAVPRDAFGPPRGEREGAGSMEPQARGEGGEGSGEGAETNFNDAGPPTESGAGGAGEYTRERALVTGGEGSGAETADSNQGVRRIMTPIDAAIEILRGQAPGRGVHVRQIADAASRRRLIHGEPNEAWRVMRTALAAESRERLRAGQRPRVRPAGSGLYALARRPPDSELERAEHVFGEARRALRERTMAALERRIADLPAPAFEALARVLLQREGFGPATFVKRVEGTVYVETLRGRGTRPSRCLVGLRPGTASAGRRAIGELRAGIKARNQDEGVLLMAGRLAEDGINEWKQPGPPVEIADGSAVAETCVRHGIGVINTMVSVDFVDADFFTELSEG
jgi:hypothetical protein